MSDPVPTVPRAGVVRRGSLWTEIGLSLALSTLAVLVLDAGVYLLATRAARQGAAEDLAEQSAEVLGAQLASTPRAGWPAVFEVHRRGALEAAVVWDASGQVLGGGGIPLPSEARAVLANRTPQTHDEDGAIVAIAPVGVERALVGVRVPIVAAGPPAWLLLGLHGIGAAGVLAAFGGALLRRRIVRPVEDLRAATARIAAGGFGEEVTTDAPRELVELAGSLTVLSRALEAYRGRTAEQLERLAAANAGLRAAQDALVRTEKLASVGQLAAGLAHELGNPLAAVRGYIDLLRMDAAPGTTQADALRRCRDEVERMHGLVRQLLDFARQEPARPEEVGAVAVVEDALASVRHQPALRGIALTTDVRVDTVRVDRARMHQALVNLFRNAADAGAATIRVEVLPLGDTVVWSVSDDGGGIPAGDLQRVFEPFYTTRPPGHGTGLGLTVVQRVAEDHGGRVEVTSRARGAGAASEAEAREIWARDGAIDGWQGPRRPGSGGGVAEGGGPPSAPSSTGTTFRMLLPSASAVV